MAIEGSNEKRENEDDIFWQATHHDMHLPSLRTEGVTPLPPPSFCFSILPLPVNR